MGRRNLPSDRRRAGAAPSAPAVFDPATLSLTGWWRANFASIPWAGTASAGTSAAKNLTNVGDVDPTTGTAQNGLTPAEFNGTSQATSYAAAISNLVGASAGSVFALVRPGSAAASSGSALTDPAFWGDDGGNLCMAFSTGGVGFGFYDGVQKRIQIACTTGAYHLLQMKWNGTNAFARVDSGGWSSLAVGPIVSLVSNLSVGKQPFVAFYDFRLLDLGFASSVLSDGTFDDIKSYVNSRYGLAL
jgi:hypothetical protein